MLPHLLMAVLYAGVALLAALEAALASFGLVPYFAGLRWLRVHFITLGVLTEVIFGLLPALVAVRAGQRRPKMRWDIWSALNVGLITLLVGIPLMNGAVIIAGGTLIFVAAGLLWKQLRDLRALGQPGPVRAHRGAPGGRVFYLAGLAYLLLGILVGTGLWVGWGEALRIAAPIEVHIHANNWGFMSLAFAGLMVDLYPSFTGRELAWPRAIWPTFWMMTLGALGLVLGPWLPSLYFSAPGLVLHLSATVWLAANMVKPIWGDTFARRGAGIWHLVTAYAWILAPVLVAPLIILKVPGFPGAGIEQNAPQALIYGWMLQFGYALIPYVLRRALLPSEPARLGGNWFSLVTAHAGGVFLWASIFVTDYQALLHGTAYALWVVSLAPVTAEIWRIFRLGIAAIEKSGQPGFGDQVSGLPPA